MIMKRILILIVVVIISIWQVNADNYDIYINATGDTLINLNFTTVDEINNNYYAYSYGGDYTDSKIFRSNIRAINNAFKNDYNDIMEFKYVYKLYEFIKMVINPMENDVQWLKEKALDNEQKIYSLQKRVYDLEIENKKLNNTIHNIVLLNREPVLSYGFEDYG